MPTIEIPRGSGDRNGDGEHMLRLEWARAMVDKAREAGAAIDWETAFGHVTTIRELYGLPLIPTGFIRGEASVRDIVRDPSNLWRVLEAFDACMQYGHDDAFSLAAVQAAELPQLLRDSGAQGSDAIYQAVLGVQPYDPEIGLRLAEAYRPDAGPEVGWAIQAQMRTF